MKQVFVLDPGLMEAGGHHAALLSTLLCYKGSDTLQIFAHKKLDETLLTESEVKGLKTYRHFESNFHILCTPIKTLNRSTRIQNQGISGIV